MQRQEYTTTSMAFVLNGKFGRKYQFSCTDPLYEEPE
jgi:hypothetical protein